MKNKFTKNDLDLWVRMNALIFDHLPQESLEDLGEDDEWIINKVSYYVSELDSKEFVLLFEDIIKLSEEKYNEWVKGDIGFLLLSEAEAVLNIRFTRKYLTKYPNDLAKPLNLNQEEENDLLNTINQIREKLPPAHKYRTDSLVEHITGVYPKYKYSCKRCRYQSGEEFVKCPACGKRRKMIIL